MNAQTQKFQIDKSELFGISFSNEEVLDSSQKQLERSINLMKSLTLGNIYKQHVKISFKNKEGNLLKTIATIWAVTEAYIILKGGLNIPIKSVLEIDFN